jgi:polyhydroxyalkanoate synthesis regulator phasin
MADRKQTRADQVRSAVDEAFAAAAGQAHTTRERAQDLVGDLTQAAGGVRGALDDLRPATSGDLRELRDEVRALSERISALERERPT